MTDLEALPVLTADLAGTGGRLKDQPEDFVVEEVPAYLPAGEGDHLFIWLEKHGLDAQGLMQRIAETLGVPDGDIGCAGQKDARAVTRQWVSVPASCEPRLNALDGGGVRVLSATRHKNKLKTGHLRGNRFRIVLRDVHADAAARAAAIVARLSAVGVPNYFGPQRFGRGGSTLRLGQSLLLGRAQLKRGRMGRLALSAVQSALFNRVLCQRLQRGDWLEPRLGDVLQVVASGGPFWVDEPAREGPRIAAREVVTTGPLFGPKMRAPRGVGLAEEEAVLAEAELTLAAFERYGKLMRGARRALCIWPEELRVSAEGEALIVEVSLPRGSYATVLLREITKEGVALEEPEEDE